MNMINRQGWLWVDANQFFGHPHISHRDLIEGDYYYDNIRQGYLIKPQSKTYTILVLKEVDFAINRDGFVRFP